MWRKTIAYSPVPEIIGDLAKLPRDFSFEFLDFDRANGPSYRLRAYVPKSFARIWSNLARIFAENNSPFVKVQERPERDGTWITWSLGSKRADASAVPTRRSTLPGGTFAIAHADATQLAALYERLDPDAKHQEAWLLQLLRQFGPLELSTRLQSNWLISELNAGASRPSAGAVIGQLPTTAVREPAPTPGRAALEQAIVQTSELLKSLARASERPAGIANGRNQMRGVLDQAKRDPATKADAAALERMFSQVEAMFRVKPTR